MQEIKTDVAVATQNKQARFPLFLARYVLIALVALIGIWLISKAYVVGSALFSLRTSQKTLQTMFDDGITNLNGDDIETLILSVRQDVLTLESETAVFYPLLTRLGWIPRIGPTLAITPQLLQMATGSTETAAYVIRGLKPAIDILKDDTLSSDTQIAALLQVIEDAKPDINQAQISIQQVIFNHQAITNIDLQPEIIQNALAIGDEWLPIANDGLTLLTILPQLAGLDSPKSYLILAQNEDELRATGGFITGSGVITVDKGQLVSIAFQDTYAVDDFTKPYGDPPQALNEIMGLELFLFRDANFWPDFPTSAQQSMALYAYGLDLPELNGAIAFNQTFLSHLLEITGPVPIPSNNVTLTSGNVKQALRNAWEEGAGEKWRGDRKDFLGTFATAVQEKLFSDPTSLNPITLAKEITTAVNQKDLMLYMTNPDVAQVLNRLDWDGRLENPLQSDFLMVADSNVGFNKTNLYIERQIAYDVVISDDFVTSSTLDISYLHNGQTAPDCAQDDILVPIQPTYSEISNQCYWNYIRIYTPINTALVQSGSYPIPQDRLVANQDWAGTFNPVQDLPGWSVFDNLLLVESGQSEPYQLSYQNIGLIHEVEPGIYQYALELDTQSGLVNETKTISISVPENSNIIEISPLPSEQNSNQLIFENIQETTIQILFK